MAESTSEFNDRMDRWLTSPDARYLDSADYTRRPSDGALMGMRAIAEADSHPGCVRDTRDVGVLLRVVGPDYVDTIVRVGPDSTLACVLAALRNQEGVVGIWVLGWDPDEDDGIEEDLDPQVTVSEGMRITSDVTGLRSTFTSSPSTEDEVVPTRRRWWHRKAPS